MVALNVLWIRGFPRSIDRAAADARELAVAAGDELSPAGGAELHLFHEAALFVPLVLRPRARSRRGTGPPASLRGGDSLRAPRGGGGVRPPRRLRHRHRGRARVLHPAGMLFPVPALGDARDGRASGAVEKGPAR